MIYTTAAGMPQVQQRVEEEIVRERERESKRVLVAPMAMEMELMRATCSVCLMTSLR